jgi:predicted transcriptional regulator
VIDAVSAWFYASFMEIPFTPAQESQLSDLARQQGRSVQDVVMDAALHRLQTEAYYLAKLDRAIAQADRGEFIEEDEMDARIEKMLARQ